jgi:hypothetical protein
MPGVVRALPALVALTLVLHAARAEAQDKIDKLIDQLSVDDFRLRTQAALALGASKSKRALNPLCKALDDDNTTVRIASASALEKLKLGGSECLQKRLADEPNASVKATIKKAMKAVGSESADEPVISSSTKYYVLIGKTTDKTGRGDGEVDGMVRKAMSKVATSLDGYALAPASETAGQAKKRFDKWKKLKGIYLLPKVSEPKYVGGKLTVRVEVSIFTYPGKALKGSVAVPLTQEGVSSRDTEAETELIKMASERVLEKFSKLADRLE